ncbi:S41 family peptidase [Gilvimarinus sp. F26214L]|uniref:S41 family peptidase n=1 Tax=Gilvimarinus sp. DZF01 TaxID=3461371 RepID=UPI0040466BD4
MRSLLTRLTIACTVLLFSLNAFAGNVAESCLEDLNYLPRFLQENDAGGRDRIKRVGKNTLDRALETARERVRRAETERSCEFALKDYLSNWREGHLTVQTLNPETHDRSIAVGDPESEYKPRVFYLSEDTALLEINSFHPTAGVYLRRALFQLRDELSSRKNWIIDVRSNHGGSDSAYQPLLPWLLSEDIVEVQLAFLATKDNIRATLEACELYAPGDDSCVEFMKPVVASMQLARPGSYVRTSEDEVEFIPIPDPVHKQPERVAILIDENCISSCEQFLLTARQSFSVKLIGRPTSGNLDYSNLRPHLLPSGKRQLLYATSRSYRLPEMPVDLAGVMPDIFLPKPESTAEWEAEVGRVRNWLEGGSLSPKGGEPGGDEEERNNQ